MELSSAILKRCSIRGFKKTPVSQETLKNVLELAVRAVSTNNIQPWEFAVVTGEALEALQEANLRDLAEDRAPDYPDLPLDGSYLDRAKNVGKALYAAMEISREDRERRAWWLRRGYAFFDAPAVILLCMDQELDEAAYRFDMGCVTQNICLAAMEYGLGTCVENQAITYQRGIREVLGAVEGKRFVCGIAIGYPDWEFPANRVVTAREPVDQVCRWYGF
jgi:nitroreductase